LRAAFGAAARSSPSSQFIKVEACRDSRLNEPVSTSLLAGSTSPARENRVWPGRPASRLPMRQPAPEEARSALTFSMRLLPSMTA
jgi:hypothetical protein